MSWRRALLFAGLGLWLCAVLGSFYLVWRYKMTPGPLAHAPAHWPGESALRRAPERANVVFIAHPQCPCTRASMNELVRLAGELGLRAKIHVLLVRPAGTEAGFEDGSIADRARTIPNVDVFVDHGGTEAARFGAIVSGSTVVFARDGKLLFRGGLTSSRGHEGRAPGYDRIVALVAGGAAERADAPTFGCALADDEITTTARTP